MRSLVRLSAWLERALGVVLAGLLVAMVAAVTWQIVTRDLLNDPSGWTEELARYLLIWIGLLGGAFGYQRRLHLGLDLLADRLDAHGAAAARWRHWQRRAIDACVLVFAVTILIGGGVALVLLTAELEQFSPALGLPMAVVYLSLPLTGALIAIAALAALADPGTDASSARARS
jgi:TRAP-type C4-dicarboxylate transport system permease small subunit